MIKETVLINIIQAGAQDTNTNLIFHTERILHLQSSFVTSEPMERFRLI